MANTRFPHTVEIFRSPISALDGGSAETADYIYTLDGDGNEIISNISTLNGGEAETLISSGEPILDEDGNEVFSPIFSSKCGMRTINKYADVNAKVIEADYKLALPSHTFIIKIGDSLKFTNGINGDVILGTVREAQAFNMGCNVWFNRTGT